MINKLLHDFLLKINEIDTWNILVVEIELQPNFIGISGFCITNQDKRISLRTRTDDHFDDIIKSYHIYNSDINNKWNKINFSLNLNRSESLSFIWDQEYQNEIDELNLTAKKQNPDYVLPKWHWEKQ